MTATAADRADRPSLLTSLGARAARRPEPRAGTVLGAAGGLLAVAGAALLALDAGGSFESERSGSSFDRLPGILIAGLVLVAGLLTLQQRRHGPFAAAGTVAVAVAIPGAIGLIALRGSSGSLDTVLGLSALAWGAAYLVGPGRGRAPFLGLGLFGAWSTAMSITGSALPSVLGLSPIGLLFGGFSRPCYTDSYSGESYCEGGGGFGFDGPDLATIGALSLSIGIAYLFVSRVLDQRGRRGMSTPFVAVGLLAVVQGLISLVIELHLRPGSVLVIATGVALAVFGADVGRRLTTYLGGLTTAIGTGLLLLPDVESAAAAGGLLVLGGALVLLGGYAVATWRDEDDDLTDPDRPDGAVPLADGPAPAPAAEVPVLEVEPAAPPPVRRPTAKAAVKEPAPVKGAATKKAPAKRAAAPAKKAAARKRPPAT